MEEKYGVDYLINAKAALIELDEAKQKRDALVIEEKKQEHLLTGEKTAVEDEVCRTIRERKSALEESYDRELSQDKEKLRKIRNRKERAKNVGQKERVKEDTAELIEHNREISIKLKTMFKQSGVPVWCNSRFFYTLFMPRSVGEILIDILLAVIVYAGIPVGFHFILRGRSDWWMIGLYTFLIFVVGGTYLFVTNVIKVRCFAKLREGRRMRDEINSNNRKIKVIRRAIYKDSSEESYDLSSYNYEIARLETEIDNLAKKKEENLSKFENVTKTVISDEIRENNRERIEKIQKEYEDLHLQLDEAEREVREKNIQITSRYESYLGREFLDISKLERLIQLMKNGEAASVMDAIGVYRDSKI